MGATGTYPSSPPEMVSPGMWHGMPVEVTFDHLPLSLLMEKAISLLSSLEQKQTFLNVPSSRQ